MKEIDTAITEWTAQTLFAPKKDSWLKFWENCTNIDVMTERHSYLRPRVKECICWLRDALILYTLDASCGSYKLEINETHSSKTEINSHYCRYLFFVCHSRFSMPRELATDHPYHLNTSQMAIRQDPFGQHHHLFTNHRRTYPPYSQRRRVAAYRRQHVDTLKCKLFREIIDYLRHSLCPSRLKHSSHCTGAIDDFKPTRTVTDLKYLLGLCMYTDSLSQTWH